MAPDARTTREEMRVARDARTTREEMRVAPDARTTRDERPETPTRVAWCEYGIRFAAAIEQGRIYATQFHPEKSQRWGLRLLENFAAIVKSSARSAA